VIVRFVNNLLAIMRLALAAIYEWPSRPVDTAVTVLGFATVAGIFAAALAMAAGYRNIFDLAAQESVAIVLSQGSDSEWASTVPTGAVADAIQAPEVARINGIPQVAPDILGSVAVQYRQRNVAAQIALRGVSAPMFTIDRALRLVRGRWFRPGLNELTVGAAAAANFRGLEPGDTVIADGRVWTVVGQFSAGSQFLSSEAWTSLGSLQGSGTDHSAYSSLFVQLTSAEAFAQFEQALNRDPQFALSVMRETTYYAHQATGLSRLITRIGSLFTTMMAAAAVFGAMSTLLAMLESRRFQVAMLRALGYPHGIVFGATLLEGSLLGSAGGVLGAAMVYVSLNGYAASTLGVGAHMELTSTTPQVFFHFTVTPSIMMQAVVLAICMGLIGGLYPALRAARMPVAAALRDI
jgi:putative ABC transport system permease protein